MNGVVNVLKPPAMSSGGVVGAIKRLFGVKKAGHTGTLDPGAAGVLPVCIGRATKLADYIMRSDKEYIAEMCVGVATDTLDSYGSIVSTSSRPFGAAQLEQVIPAFTGEIMQTAPAYSAVKHEGTPLYKLARKGIRVEKPPRSVTVRSIEILGHGENRFLLQIACSHGTYIRSLVADMAARLGSCAYTSFLLRTKTCGLATDDAWTLDELVRLEEKESALIGPDDAVGFLEKVTLKDYLFDIVASGAPVDLRKAALDVREGTEYAVFCRDRFMGVAAVRDGALKMKTMYYVG